MSDKCEERDSMIVCVKNRMKDLRWSVQTLSDRVDIPSFVLERYLDGQVRIQKEPFNRLLQALGLVEGVERRFRVALSFPGEHREYISEIANILAKELTKSKVFYDEFHQAELAIPNLDTYLQKIYHDDSDLVVVFLCKEYEDSEWCGLEIRSIKNLIKQQIDSRIMFVRIAEGDVSGIFGIDGFVDAQEKASNDVADLILERLKIQLTICDLPS